MFCFSSLSCLSRSLFRFRHLQNVDHVSSVDRRLFYCQTMFRILYFGRCCYFYRVCAILLSAISWMCTFYQHFQLNICLNGGKKGHRHSHQAIWKFVSLIRITCFRDTICRCRRRRRRRRAATHRSFNCSNGEWIDGKPIAWSLAHRSFASMGSIRIRNEIQSKLPSCRRVTKSPT